ncbi:GNAT family N-acetyltransferase [Paenibacillus sp. CAA11]|uniref:GNAT family N-acetyltransferase n=1 Tax=Paenibacillus sp. CAA11 TaxID=1532905 RepID=UPI000D3C2F50|nr:GNAT family N-acetyltransferase [Paenibacillus sp. CAA11]AWB44506.1 GNAT family N-acetyltransferase [Paenibacillus sp. CAA11]
MEIRNLLPEEIDKSLDLSEYAFQYKLTEEARNQRRDTYKLDCAWGVFEEGQMQAKLHLFPFQTYVQGKIYEMGGIAGVATWPENRRKGHVRALINHALRVMNEKGQWLSLLHPFSIPFYRKFGWEVLTEVKRYTLYTAEFPEKKETEGVVRRDVQHVEHLDQVYQQFAQNYSGMLVRSESWWKDSVLDEEIHNAVYYSKEGHPEGYLLYKLENKELIADEFVFLHETARTALWTFLANHDSRVNKITVMNVPQDDIFPFLLANPKISQEISPLFMARIVNVQQFVQQYPFVSVGQEVNLTIQIEDQTAAWNQGKWQLRVSAEGEGLLTPAASSSGEPDILLNINSLTALLIGYMRAEVLFRSGKLTGSEEAVQLIDKVLPHKPTAFLDYF